MPPLHIKLGLIRQFVTALDKDSAAFKYLQVLFPKLSEAKVKAGIFAGPQIKKIIECDEFIKLLSRKQKTAWNSFVALFIASWVIKRLKTMCSCFRLSERITPKWDAEYLSKSKSLTLILKNSRRTWKLPSRYNGLWRCLQGQYNENMMRDYIWGLIRESDLQYTRNSRKLLISEPFWVIFDSLCLLTIQVLFFISPHEQKCKTFLVFSQ